MIGSWSSPESFKGFTGTASVLSAQVLAGDVLTTPSLLIKDRALQWNLERMAKYCRSHGVDLAPHGKTTMSPQIIRQQLDHGAWGITVASVSQARILESFGIERMLIANEVVDSAGIQWLSRRAKTRDATDTFVFVDSVEGVERLSSQMSSGAISVFVELGVWGGRAGCRTLERAEGVMDALTASPHLEFAGMACFEGILGGRTRTPEGEGEVTRFLQWACRMLETIAEAHPTDRQLIFTAGGSAYFNLVVAAAKEVLGSSVRVLLRSGCYVTHDHGVYENLTPWHGEEDSFRPALELIASVLSRPEPDLAIVDFGRRDAPYDSGLPIAIWIGSPDRQIQADIGLVEVTQVNDQHAYLKLDRDLRLPVGELIGFGISHPCSAFDRWRVIPVVDDDYRIVSVAETYF